MKMKFYICMGTFRTLPKGWYTLKITLQNNTFTTLKFIKS
jgi:hypothetical protein